MVVREALTDHDLEGFPKTSGSRGMHVNVRVKPEQDFTEVRRAALALAREVERRVPKLATSKWWKEERHGVFVDYNQNARDRTVASAYSVRPVPDARVSCPLHWEEVPDVEPAELRLDTVPARLKDAGDPSAAIDAHPGSLDSLLELAARDEAEGLGDAPWPPHFAKQRGEPKRVQPSRARKAPGTRRAPKG
jgi:DNA primase